MAASSFEAVATAVIAVFNAEFSTEGFVMIPDNLHESLGRERVDVGISPIEDVVNVRDSLVQETWVEVKFYHLWAQEITPTTTVNPFLVTMYAERFRDALRRARATDAQTGQVWFFDLRRVQYPNDPTGNKTRFVATIRAYGNNSGLIETSP